MKTWPEWKAIAAHYGDNKAKRSGCYLMDHTDGGLAILAYLGASLETKKAFCLHPKSKSGKKQQQTRDLQISNWNENMKSFIQTLNKETAKYIAEEKRIKFDENEGTIDLGSRHKHSTEKVSYKLIKIEDDIYNFVKFTVNDYCYPCEGIGWKIHNFNKCKFCDGDGKIKRLPCKSCGGDGCEYVSHGREAINCPKCKGTGFETPDPNSP